MGRAHDANYKLYFSFVIVLEHYVRALCGPEFAAKLDFGTARPLSSEFASRKGTLQFGDMLWLVERRDGLPDVMILIEFQSDIQNIMVLRVLSYIGNAYQNLFRWKVIKPSDEWPQIIPGIVHNGLREWPGVPSLFALRVPELVSPELRRLVPPELLGAGDGWLSDWIQVLDMRRYGAKVEPELNLVHALGRAELNPFAHLDEARREVHVCFPPGPEHGEMLDALDTCLAELGKAWDIPKPKMKLLLEGGTMHQAMREVREQVHRDGVAQGVAQGMAQGAVRLARRKYGAATAERLATALETADAERIVVVFDAVSECDTASELLIRIGEF